MSTTALGFLFKVERPWIFLGLGEPDRKAWNPAHFYSQAGLSACVRRLRGKKMHTTVELMDEFAAALQFFDDFGENWYALEDCLGCLDEWLPADAYVLVVEQAEELLQGESMDELASLLKVLDTAGETWAKPIIDNDRFNREAVPFHVLLNLSTRADSASLRITKAASIAGIELRRHDGGGGVSHAGR